VVHEAPSCTVGRELPPPPRSSANAEALQHLRQAYQTWQAATLEQTDVTLNHLLDDPERFGHDDREEPREAYGIGGLECESRMAPAEQLRALTNERGRALVARYPKGVYSGAIGKLLHLPGGP
jgi:hypothetical protein